MRSTPLRLAAITAATVLTVVALTGCSADGAGDCSPEAAAGQASDAVQVSGTFGAKPTVSFPQPLHVTRTQVSQVTAGSGAPIGAAQLVVADVTFLNATTGQVASESQYTGVASAPQFVLGTVPLPGLRKAMVCARVGERLAAVLAPGDGFPAASRPAGVAASDSLVAVVDVRRAYLARANGDPQVMAGGLPSVVLGGDGRPGISLPEGNPPTTLQVADLRAGDGVQLKRGDKAVVHYTGVIWKPGDAANKTVVDSSWQAGTPRTLPVQDGQIVKGLVSALAGQRVGSQVLAVLPPSQAYGQQGSGTVPAGATLVFVVDILGKA